MHFPHNCETGVIHAKQSGERSSVDGSKAAHWTNRLIGNKWVAAESS